MCVFVRCLCQPGQNVKEESKTDRTEYARFEQLRKKYVLEFSDLSFSTRPRVLIYTLVCVIQL